MMREKEDDGDDFKEDGSFLCNRKDKTRCLSLKNMTRVVDSQKEIIDEST